VRVVFVPGFTQTCESWRGVIDTLGSTIEPLALDVPPGHDWSGTARRLAEAGGAGTWVGYSMGGRLAVQVALDRPDLVERLILVSTTAGLRSPADAAARRASDHELADHIEAIGVDAFLVEWLAQPLFERVPANAPGVAERARWSAADLAGMLRTLGTGSMPNLWPRLGELELPITIVTGRHDPKFCSIGDELAVACSRCSVERVTVEAGHAIPLERPDLLGKLFTPTDRT
jgi:2-succinyl-6-hydroxy-2,4-cyclohexadiene-1-carboxylate synthase